MNQKGGVGGAWGADGGRGRHARVNQKGVLAGAGGVASLDQKGCRWGWEYRCGQGVSRAQGAKGGTETVMEGSRGWVAAALHDGATPRVCA